jgi:putative membrane protein insertion efficiency factor
MTRLLLALLRFYQLALSPFIGRSCRFHPSCSNYAAEAIREHGPAKGVFMAGKRVCKCNPWHPGGYDPVPLKDSNRFTPDRRDSRSDTRNDCHNDSRFSEFS